MRVNGRIISRGVAEGEVLLSRDPISFLGEVDAKTGRVVEKGHAIEGKNVKGKVLVFPRGKGSTVGSYAMLQLKKNGVGPAAIINLEAEAIIAVGAILSNIPMLDRLERDPFSFLKNGMRVRVDAEKGFLEY